jgi:hypothetical protein
MIQLPSKERPRVVVNALVLDVVVGICTLAFPLGAAPTGRAVVLD